MKGFFSISAAVLLLPLLLLPACKKGEKGRPQDPAATLKRLQKTTSFEEITACYSPGTLRVLESLRQKGSLSKAQARAVMKILDEKISWEVVSEKKNKERASLLLVFTAHPVENRIGQKMPVQFKKIEGRWRIDMEKDLRVMADAPGRAERGNYLEKRLKVYR